MSQSEEIPSPSWAPGSRRLAACKTLGSSRAKDIKTARESRRGRPPARRRQPGLHQRAQARASTTDISNRQKTRDAGRTPRGEGNAGRASPDAARRVDGQRGGGGQVRRRRLGRPDQRERRRPAARAEPARADYVRARAGGLRGKRVADVGCGGGLLARALAAAGADVVGLDASPRAAAAAAARAAAGPRFAVVAGAPEALLADGTLSEATFDVVCALEVLEHVADDGAFVAACARLARAGGDVFLSTLNRTPLAAAASITIAEGALGLLPRGTHDAAKFRTPGDVAALLGAAGCRVRDARALHFAPAPRGPGAAWLGGDARGAVNFVVHATREA